jgi:aspartate/methionine/tyrosine aminotransferase
VCFGQTPQTDARTNTFEHVYLLLLLFLQGTYFLVADVSSWLRPGEDDVSLCKRLTAEAGVTLIPISAFYASDARPHHLVR